MENPAILIWREYKMGAKTFIKCFIFLTILLMSFSISYAELYSGGPWRGRVIDADTKEPIEGAVVVAVWERRYDCGFNNPTYFQEAREVLTDKEGRFEISAYTENRGKLFWRAQDKLNDSTSLLICTGPEIREPNFIIYKPSYDCYRDFRCSSALHIYPIGPGPSKVEYHEEHKEMYKGREVVAWAKKKTKTFPEGLVYYGTRCKSKIDALEKTLSFKFGSFFIPIENAKERAEKLDIPLDCPDNGEPIPGSMHGFRDDTISPLHKSGGYIIIELPKVKTWIERIERHEAVHIDVPNPDKILPNLMRILKEEDDYLQPMYRYNREKLNIPVGKIPE